MREVRVAVHRSQAGMLTGTRRPPPPPLARPTAFRFPPETRSRVTHLLASTPPPQGKVVTDGSVVSLQYVLRRPNGYFVDASYGFDRLDLYTYTAGSGGVVAGFDAAVRGMAPGGRRRFVVPPAVGYVGGVGGGKPGPIPPGWGERRALASHIGEDLIFEVRVVRVK